jgi:hypothetical protein
MIKCIKCKHECHCKDRCNSDSANGGCGCSSCIHPEKKSLWKKIKNWLI